ncbi:MAG: MGMT family protein [Chloroflexota bacterium]|nr:MGMT family protein [Chloroflexota bacterium]
MTNCANKLPNTFEKIYTVVSSIPPGLVMTYSQVALYSGVTNPRLVGNALFRLNENHRSIPWQRVVNSRGKISDRSRKQMKNQKNLLESEGVCFDKNDRIDLDIYGV